MKKELPTDKPTRARVLRQAMDLARSFRNPLSVEWAYTYWYMQGIRNFHVTSYRDGTFRWAYESPEGTPNLRVEDTVKQYQRQLGLVNKINIQPAVTPKGLGLQSMQNAAFAQAILDYITTSIRLPDIFMESGQLALMYGVGAVVAAVNEDVSLVGIRPSIRNAPPWNILPDPARPTRREEVDSLFNHRWVPYEWAKAQYKGRLVFPADDAPELKLRRIQMGDKVQDDYSDNSEGAPLVKNRQPGGSGDATNPKDEPWVELTEWWNYDECERVQGYEVMLGDWVATKDTFKTSSYSKQPCLPIGVYGCQLTGGFWNRGWAPMLIPTNIELEYMAASQFKNVKEADSDRWLAISNTMGITRESIMEDKGRPKVLMYEPDYTAPGIKPEMIQFQTTGDFPGRVMGTAIQIMDRLGNASDLFNGKAPGRVDSASGLGLLYETVGIQNIPMAASFNRAYSTIYKALLQQAKKLLSGKKLLPIMSLDDNLVGIKIDTASGQMSFEDDAVVPDPDDVIITIRDQQPRMQEQQRQDLMAMRDKQQITPLEFAWYNYKNKLELPAGYETEIEEIRKCKFRNLVQWNDGKTPGGVTTSALDMHKIQMAYMKRFMAQPIFGFADEKVRDAFEQRYNFHQQALGGFPEGMPYPEDAAASAAQSPDSWGSAGGMDPSQLPPQLAKMLQQPPEAEQGQM